MDPITAENTAITVRHPLSDLKFGELNIICRYRVTHQTLAAPFVAPGDASSTLSIKISDRHPFAVCYLRSGFKESGRQRLVAARFDRKNFPFVAQSWEQVAGRYSHARGGGRHHHVQYRFRNGGDI